MSKNTGTSVFQLKNRSENLGGIQLWTLVFDLPGEKVNKLSSRVIDEFEALVSQLETQAKEGRKENKIDVLVLLSGKPGNFIAGADIELIQSTTSPQEAENLSRRGQNLLNRWEDLPFPTVAGIQGAALGGGCEFALGSSAIVMSNDPAAKIGLPEVMLGLIPGMGGCVRLPRKIGLTAALDFILTGKTVGGEKACKLGLAEACLPKENFEDSVLRWTRDHFSALAAKKPLARKPGNSGVSGIIGALLENTAGSKVIFSKARTQVLSKTHGHYPAPLEALEVLQDTWKGHGPKLRGKDRENAMVREAKGFGKMAATDVSKNLIRLFFLTEAVKKTRPGPSSIHHAAVLGAGVMGGGIAQLFAAKDISVRLKDVTSQALSVGIASASSLFQKQVKRKKLNPRQALQKLNQISPVLDFGGFKSVDLVVEAIIEDRAIKTKVFQDLEERVRSNCILVSNTSSLSISKMQADLKHPERFGGMHFFNPVHKMPLVEVIQGEKTSDETVTSIFQFTKAVGKTPVIVKDSPGFLVNRLLMPYLNEAIYLLAEGVSIEKLDSVLVQFGMPMGPIELIDEVGIDVGEKVSHILFDAFGSRMEPSHLLKENKLVEAGRLGKKVGKGFYLYEGSKKVKQLDPSVYSLLGIKVSSQTLPDEEILERCLLPMLNEASRCLEEKIVASESDVDLAMIMGTGFPPFRGGLLRYADFLGPKTIVSRLKKYEKHFGARFQPSSALGARAESGQKFYKD